MNRIAPRRSNVLVMHPDPLLCAGLVAALSGQARFEVAVGDADAALSGAGPVDVVIVDYADALRLALAPSRSLAAARILVLTGNDREADIRRAIEAGVHGYLLLGGPIDELVEGVASVAGGDRYVGRAVAQRMADSLTRAALTGREIEVLGRVAGGESNKAIARELRIEVGTVKSHMSAIMAKLGATSRTQAAAIAIGRGLVTEPVPDRHAPLSLPQAWTCSAASRAASSGVLPRSRATM